MTQPIKMTAKSILAFDHQAFNVYVAQRLECSTLTTEILFEIRIIARHFTSMMSKFMIVSNRWIMNISLQFVRIILRYNHTTASDTFYVREKSSCYHMPTRYLLCKTIIRAPFAT